MQSGIYLPTAAIAAALALDLMLGDPSWMPHPVRFIGRAVVLGEGRMRTGEPRADLWRGALVSFGIVIATALAASVAIAIVSAIANWLGGVCARCRAVTQRFRRPQQGRPDSSSGQEF